MLDVVYDNFLGGLLGLCCKVDVGFLDGTGFGLLLVDLHLD